VANREHKPYPKHERVRPTHPERRIGRVLRSTVLGRRRVTLVVRLPKYEAKQNVRKILQTIVVISVFACCSCDVTEEAGVQPHPIDGSSEFSEATMDWFDATSKYHERTFPHDCRLDSLGHDWQREMAALWRLEADVNNGGYLQFLENWGRESYVYASQGLKRMGALRMARIVDACQAIVDEHYSTVGKAGEQVGSLAPYRAIMPDGTEARGDGVLPEAAIARILELSYEFMEYPDSLEDLGPKCYWQYRQDE